MRVPGAEDHFALLAIHLLKHGAWRPTWLCDLGLLLESMPADFDWDLCLGKTKRRANWILSAIELAHELVGAEIGDEEIAARASEIPAWLARSVLKEWETPFAIDQPPMSHRAPMRSYLRHPRGFLSDLAHRWPNPILATISVNGEVQPLAAISLSTGKLSGPRGSVHHSETSRGLKADKNYPQITQNKRTKAQEAQKGTDGYGL